MGLVASTTKRKWEKEGERERERERERNHTCSSFAIFQK
jgi:hypothetical protein